MLLAGCVGNRATPSGSSRSPRAVPTNAFQTPPLEVGQLIVPGVPGAPSAGPLRTWPPFSRQIRGAGESDRQWLEKLIDEQVQKNEADLLTQARQLGESHRQGLLETAQQRVATETTQLNDRLAGEQRRLLLQGQYGILNKQLDAIALERPGSSPASPGFDKKLNTAQYEARRGEFDKLRNAQSDAIAEIARKHQQEVEQARKGLLDKANTEADQTEQILALEARHKSETEGQELRDYLRETIDPVGGSAPPRSAVASEIARLNARSRAVDAQAVSRVNAWQAAAQRARQAQEAQRRRMAQAGRD